MNKKQTEQVVKIARRLEKVPKKLGWRITAVIYGHGKVVVQAVDKNGKAVQFTGKVDNG